MSALSTGGMPEARAGFDSFVTGFNQASKRYLMVDVGYGKEVADSKLRGVYRYFISIFVFVNTYEHFLLFSYIGKRYSFASDFENHLWWWVVNQIRNIWTLIFLG